MTTYYYYLLLYDIVIRADSITFEITRILAHHPESEYVSCKICEFFSVLPPKLRLEQIAHKLWGGRGVNKVKVSPHSIGYRVHQPPADLYLKEHKKYCVFFDSAERNNKKIYTIQLFPHL